MNVIEVQNLIVKYGGATALDGVSLAVSPGEPVALVGANGAGKTTLLNALSAVVRPAAGQIRIRGRFAHVPEGRQLFPDLSVDDNLRLGAYRVRDRETAWIYRILPELERTRKQRAGSLSGGQQQMVAIGRGLMGQPDVMAIDEMSLGLAPIVARTLIRVLGELNRERGLAVLLVEQSARLAFSLCTRAYVLDAGRLAASGTPRELIDSGVLSDVYLGAADRVPA
ncbi:MAG TPA: ABC transporter ATP-binding protein [Polyangiaceae bacterium]|jgi:branched-chain amino acid transport system ATP-binding protein|nr:ABC transporter ATP-binding protein [Polyangiaceae bacterium]